MRIRCRSRLQSFGFHLLMVTILLTDWPSPLFLEALGILANCECHPGAVCRTAFALSEAYLMEGNEALAQKYLAYARTYDISDDSACSMPMSYDKFVTVGLR